MEPISISSPYLAMTVPSACSSGGPWWLGGSSGEIYAKYFSKPAGRNDLKRPRRAVSRVLEGVGDTPGLEDQVAGGGDADPFSDLVDTDLAFEHVGVLVFVLVRVHRGGEDAGCYRVLDQREPPPL